MHICTSALLVQQTKCREEEWTFAGAQSLPSGGVPKPYAAIHASARQDLCIWRPRKAQHPVPVTLQEPTLISDGNGLQRIAIYRRRQ